MINLRNDKMIETQDSEPEIGVDFQHEGGEAMSFDQVIQNEKTQKSVESEADIHDLEIENQPSA